MGLPSTDMIVVINYLLPGFITAWIFYGLTAHRKDSSFERVIQALIFTGFVQAIVYVIESGSLMIGSHFIVIGEWQQSISFVVSVLVAIFLGLIFSAFANTSYLHEHRWAQWIKTKKTSHPSEWYSAFKREDPGYLKLVLKDKRILYGWNTEWPDHPDQGHFVIHNPEWVKDDGEREPISEASKIVMPVSNVDMVLFTNN